MTIGQPENAAVGLGFVKRESASVSALTLLSVTVSPSLTQTRL